tara:strand:+ start:703 stop:1329 length:627 start_codon:yes stop_codon:yes gene_type:complete
LESVDETMKLNWSQYFNPVITIATISGMLYLIGFTRSAVIARDFGVVNLTLSEPIQATIANGFMVTMTHIPELFAILILTFLLVFLVAIRRRRNAWVIDENRLHLVGWAIAIATVYSTLGVYSGAERSNSILEIVLNGCKLDCRTYKTAEKSYVGLLIQGNEEYQMIYTKTGVVVLPIVKIKSIHTEGLKPKKLPVAWEILPSFPDRY